MNNQLLNDYLSKKGFTPEDLFVHKAIFLDSGNIVSTEDKNSWFYKEFSFIDPEGKDAKLTPHDVVLKKRYQYGLDNCDSAIFVPLFRLSGEFTGFSIRKVGGSTKHDSWFIPGHKKLDLLYNLLNSYEPAVKKNSIILTEGVYDTIALCKYGFTNSAALLGTNLSTMQFFQISSMVENIALCLDNDEAGKKAIDKIITEHPEGVKFWLVDIDKDPDEFLKEHGAAEFKKRIHPCTKN